MMDIATGNAEDHPSLLPYDPGQSPGTAPMTPTSGLLTPADQGGVFDAAGDQADRLGGYEADIRAAQSSGMSAENDRRAHYGSDILPVGAAYGDAMNLPVVPDSALPPASSDLYPWSGLEPTPAAAGIGGYVGDEPRP